MIDFERCFEMVRQVAAEAVAGSQWRLYIQRLPMQNNVIEIIFDDDRPVKVNGRTKYATASTAVDVREIAALEGDSPRLIGMIRKRIERAISSPKMVSLFEVNPPITLEPGDGESE